MCLLPLPVHGSGSGDLDPEERRLQQLGAINTYSNSLMVNKTVIIPFDDDTAKNNAAVAAYKIALPDYEIVGVNSESTIVQGGSIHCITKEIPVPTPSN